MKVFISHSGIDTWVARQIQLSIIDLGVNTFLDDACLAVGDDFEKIILHELQTSNELVVLLTPWSLERPYVWLEVGAAWISDIRIVGIFYGLTLEELSSNIKNPIFIKKNNLISLNDFDTYLEQLSKRVHHINI